MYWAPTTPSPIIINNLPLPFSDTVRDSPTVPPAPARLNTSTFSVAPTSSITLAAARAVVSYPLPGVFGTMNRSPVRGSSAARSCPARLYPPWPRTRPSTVLRRRQAAAPNLSRLNIIVPLVGPAGHEDEWLYDLRSI